MFAPEDDSAAPRPQSPPDRPRPRPLCAGLFGVRGQAAAGRAARDPHPPVEEPRSGLWL